MELRLVLSVILLCALEALADSSDVALEFIILHNNDMHARFEQTSRNSGQCTPKEAAANECYGGFPRVAYEVRKYRKEAENGGLPVIYLNAGDTYTGTPWFTVFKDNITATMLNELQPDAVSLGNHEFDEGVDGLVPFLNRAKFPVLAANLNLSLTPELAATKSLMNHTILEIDGIKIGVIGYITPETENLVIPNDVRFTDEIDAINAESEVLKRKGINIIIALGHSGYEKDQEIAMKCPNVDIVIGGHSHTFLYTGPQPDAEDPEGPYPTFVKRPISGSGKLKNLKPKSWRGTTDVPVVQSYAYTKYLGKLHVQFNSKGDLIEIDGTPILLNASIPRDTEIIEILDVYRPNITALESNTVARTKVFLEGSAAVCRKFECNLGNFITDSMVYARILEEQGGAYWTDTPIAIMGGGGIRSSIELRSDGSITGADLLTVLPFDNDLVVTRLYGKTLRQALEHSAHLRNLDSNGGFLQMSGIHVTYDNKRKVGSRVVDVQVRCAECLVPHYEPLDDNKLYRMVVQKFLYNKGDGTIVHEPDTQPITLKLKDAEALKLFLESRGIIYPEIEGRITVLNPKSMGSTLKKVSLFGLNLLFILSRLV